MPHVFFATLFWLVAAHALCDFSLQGDTMAREKNPDSTSELQRAVPWFYWMAAHALIHGGAVALVTHSLLLGVCEALLHFAIDLMKCLRWLNIHQDQTLHLLCKVIWAANA